MANSALGSLAIAGERGKPLPQIPELQPLYQNGNNIYAGGVVMIAGPPKARKTMFMLWLANRLDIPVLYFSADSDATVMASRLAAMRMNQTTQTVRYYLKTQAASQVYEALNASKINFIYHPSPGILDVEDEINAYVEQYETYPPIIVLDNLLDMATGGNEAEHLKFKEILKELKILARDTGACVFVLHHMLESNNNYSPYPKPRSALAAKVSQTPAQIWSVSAQNNDFYYSIVADRNGNDDPSGKHYYRLSSDPDKCMFTLPEVIYG